MLLLNLESFRKKNPELVDFALRLIRKVSGGTANRQEESTLARIAQILTDSDNDTRFITTGGYEND